MTKYMYAGGIALDDDTIGMAVALETSPGEANISFAKLAFDGT